MKSIFDVCHELFRWLLRAGDVRSFAQLARDMVVSRIKGAAGGNQADARRTVRLRDGTLISYRFNRGDLWSFREVMLDECYRFPAAIKPDAIIDLGANIGLTSLWMGKKFKPRTQILVEPAPDNASLARHNLEQNNIPCTLIEAAVGDHDGTISFVKHAHSNMGQADYKNPGATRLVSMATVLREVPEDRTSILLKVDIEGGEASLFSGNLQWLDRIDAVIAEFHPTLVDPAPLIRTLEAAGFSYLASNSVFPGSMDAFVRSRALERVS